MGQSQTVSQLTLIKTFSSTNSVTLHTQLHRKPYAFEMKVDQNTSVQSFINEAVELLMGQISDLAVDREDCVFELYAARKNGRKVSDLPSFEGQQKILKTGEKCFYLLVERKEDGAALKSNTISTKSIRSEMKPLEIKNAEQPMGKERGCFCFS